MHFPPRQIWDRGSLEYYRSSLPVILTKSEWGDIYFEYHILKTNAFLFSLNVNLLTAQ